MAKNSELFAPCRTMTDLVSCLSAPSHCVPTVEFAVRNIELPLSKEDFDWLSQPQINIFSTNQEQNKDQRYARSRNLTDMTVTFDVPFVLLGICVYAYGEPTAMSVPGNCFDRALTSANPLAPASPLNMRAEATAIQQLLGAAAPIAPSLANPAVINWGNPVWKLIWAFMHSRRLVMRCPTSSYEILLDEALADLGNCGSQTELAGFGTSKADHMLYARRLNDRIGGLLGQLPDGTVDPGVFMPINADQTANGAGGYDLEPNRLFPDFANFGRSFSMPTVEQWYRLPAPIPFPAVPQPKIKISLDRANGDDPYLERALQEGSLANLFPDASVEGKLHNLAEPGAVALTQRGYVNEVVIPGGQLRIGVGLKGFEVRGSVCDQLLEMYEGKSGTEMADAVANLTGGQIKSGRINVGCSGPVGSPQE